MTTYYKWLFVYLFCFINAQVPPRTGKFKKAPSIIEKNRPHNYVVRGMRTFWFEHGIKMIRHMTHEVYIDVDTKYSQAIYVKKKYDHSITYQLGATAASIMDNFEDMLITYRRYANLSTLKTARTLKYAYDLRSYNEALLTLQGLYYQIRVKEYVFNNAVERLLMKYARIRRQREKKQAGMALRTGNNQKNILRTSEAQQNILQTRDNQKNILRTSEAQQNILKTKDNQQNILQTRDNQQNILRTSKVKQNILQTRDNQQNILQTNDNRQNILQTRDNQQNILQTRDNQQNSDIGSKDNSFGLIGPEQSSEISDPTKIARQNNAKSRSIKKPLWVYKEPKDNNY